MIDTLFLLSLMEKASGDSKLKSGFDILNLSLPKDLALNDDEYRAYVEYPEFGLCIIFTDESYFAGKASLPIGSGKLFYSGLFFHSEGKDGYSEYKGKLPFGLLFTDTRQDVVNKLGQQSWQRLARDKQRVISDRWDDLPDVPYRLHITYNKDTGRISIISVNIPDKPLS
ncbi:hypothetical protein CEQ48_18140 [Vibrio tarriae]|uniref:Uncharacterized protein n=1 Tax=Vibrio tarriae TaxID=2014742 RepID=A0AAU8WK62_9VIBR|nr:hypothetical protein [Vibrio tarriae]ASK56567.1 hypothetical protein CEQ48_18140 [Vibrio tarriae]